ncbi:MAG: ABC transporter ATP-binding protein/permease [Firmicutes bacterium]|nr:ABC transporter ATP-binding protein/permease [Bacillota bacterium]
MKKKKTYFKHTYLTVFTMLIVAFITFKLSFALYDLVNAALASEWDMFFVYAKSVIFYAVIMMPSNLLYAYTKGRVIKTIMVKMKKDYIQSVFHKNINEFQHDNNALYVSALTNDFNLIEKDYVEQIIVLQEALINFGTSILIITIISPIILLIGIGMIIINALISVLSSKPIQKHNKERSEMMSKYGGFIKEVLSAFHIIKTNNLESKVTLTYNQESKKVQEKKYVIDKIMSFIFALQNINFGITFIGLMFVVSFLTIKGIILFSGVVVVAQNIDNIIGPVSQFSEALPRIFSVKAIFVRIDNSLKNQTNYEETKSFEGLQHSIEFKNVSFAYGDNVVLESVNLKFEKGKKYLVIGPSGGGKSTVLRLLRKYFNPQSGNILVDGMELKDIFKMDYFSKIANIEQQIFLFEDTLKNNLALYKDYSDDEIWDAIDRAGLHDFVSLHPDGLNRVILDNGKNVSGGEKSRIAIARGLLNKADIIFFDEAFASLDREKVLAIENSLFELKGVTIVNVSHVILEENKNKYDEIVLVKNTQISSVSSQAIL